MGKINIQDLLLFGERLTLECKAAENALPKSVWETYSSFSNTEGGVILLGIKEDLEELERSKRFSIVGVNNPSKIIKEFWDTINSDKVNINLLRDDDVYEESMAGKLIIVIIIPQADYLKRPVFINGNPFKGTFKRTFEGDYHCSESEVKAMIRDSNEEGNDGTLLEHYTLDDVDLDAVHGYRNRFQSRNPDHVWNAVDDLTFLRNFGCMGKDRSTGKEWLTVAGLMMFGKGLSVRERFSNIRMDYIDQTNLMPDSRWSDRLTYDGRWENNLYNFYSLVMPKLTFDLRRPFVLKGMERDDDTPVHKAIREAFTNMIIHSDLMITGVLKIVKKDHCFIFSNPGTLKLPLERIYNGGASKARNPRLQNLLRMIGLGENLGSGFPTILSAWEQEKWKTPDLREDYDLRQVDLKLWMVSLFPKEAIEELQNRFGKVFNALPANEKAVMVTVLLEKEVNSPRIQNLLNLNMIEVGKLLFHLTNTGFLISTGRGRGTTYRLTESPDISVNPHDQININDAVINIKDPEINIKDPGVSIKDRKTIEVLRERVLEFCKTPHTTKEILHHIERSYQYRNVQVFIKALVEQGKLIPENAEARRNVKYVVPKD